MEVYMKIMKYILLGILFQHFGFSEPLNIYYNISDDLYGFQFDITGATATGASGGEAGDAGFIVNVGGSGTLLGFSFSGDVLIIWPLFRKSFCDCTR